MHYTTKKRYIVLCVYQANNTASIQLSSSHYSGKWLVIFVMYDNIVMMCCIHTLNGTELMKSGCDHELADVGLKLGIMVVFIIRLSSLKLKLHNFES